MSMFDDIIKDKANSHEAPVPPGAWDKIAKKKRRRRSIIWYWILAAGIIAGVGTPAYLYLKNNEIGKKSVAEKKTKNDPASNGQQKNNTIETTNTNEKDKATVPENITQSISINQQTVTAAPVSSTQTSNKQQDLATKNKIRISKRPATTINSSAADISGIDLSSGKTIEKQTKGKLTTATVNAETGETTQNNIDTKINNATIANEVSFAASKTVVTDKTVIPAQQEIKKQETDTTKNKPSIVANKPTEGKKKHLFADISFMPFIPFQRSNTDAVFSRSALSNNVLSEFKSSAVNTTLDPSVAFQFALRKNISSKWLIGTGLQYMQLKETIQLAGEETATTTRIVQRLVTQNGLPVLVDDTIQTVVKGNREINAVNSYRFISIPLFMQYNAGKFAGLNFSITGGLYFNIHSRYSNSINPVISSQNNTATSNTGIDMFAGLRLSKMYGRRIGLFAEPSVRFNIKQANIKQALLNKPLQQAGIAIGGSVLLK